MTLDATIHLSADLIGELNAAQEYAERMSAASIQARRDTDHLVGHVISAIPTRSPRWIRGKIARMLASKISIAARLDAFEGTPMSQDDVDQVEAKVEAIRKEFPKPPRR